MWYASTPVFLDHNLYCVFIKLSRTDELFPWTYTEASNIVGFLTARLSFACSFVWFQHIVLYAVPILHKKGRIMMLLGIYFQLVMR